MYEAQNDKDSIYNYVFYEFKEPTYIQKESRIVVLDNEYRVFYEGQGARSAVGISLHDPPKDRNKPKHDMERYTVFVQERRGDFVLKAGTALVYVPKECPEIPETH